MRFDAGTGAARLGPVPINRAGFTSLMITSDGRRLVAVGDGETVVRDAQDLRVLERWPCRPPRRLPVPAHRARSQRPHGGDRGPGRLRTAPRPGHRQAADRVGPPRRGGPRDPLHAPRPFPRQHGGRRRRDPAGTSSGRPPARHCPDQPGPVLSPQITRDGRTLYTAGPGAAVFIWDLVGTRRLGRPFTTGAPSSRPGLAAVSPGPAFLALSADGRLIAKGQDDGAINVIDAHTLVPHKPFPIKTAGPVHGLGFVPGSHLLVVTGNRSGRQPRAGYGFVALADADRGRLLELTGQAGTVLPPSISADRRLLVTARASTSARPTYGRCPTSGRWAAHCCSAGRSLTCRSAQTDAG